MSTEASRPFEADHARLEAEANGPIDELMRLFYRVISFEEGGSPDWQSMERLFSAHARITRVTPEATDHLDLKGFRDMAEELIELGAFTSFFEREIARRVDHFGGVLHVASAYETKISPDAADYIERGVNSLQLIREEGTWKICSLCWDDQAAASAERLKRETTRPLPSSG
jgi:hypothetical protein